MSNKEAVELQIAEYLKIGDEKAVALIYDNYGAVLFGLCRRMMRNQADAEEAFQEAIYKVWKAGSRFDAQKAGLYAWMINLTRNQCIDMLRKKNRRPQIQDDQDDVTLHRVHSEENSSVDFLGLKGEVDKLRTEDRQVLELSYFEGYSHAEIAKKLKLPLGTVKTRARKAIQDLKLLLRNEIGY